MFLQGYIQGALGQNRPCEQGPRPCEPHSVTFIVQNWILRTFYFIVKCSPGLVLPPGAFERLPTISGALGQNGPHEQGPRLCGHYRVTFLVQNLITITFYFIVKCSLGLGLPPGAFERPPTTSEQGLHFRTLKRSCDHLKFICKVMILEQNWILRTFYFIVKCSLGLDLRPGAFERPPTT